MKRVFSACAVILLLIIVGAAVTAGLLYKNYRDSIDKPASSSSKEVEFTIEVGETTEQIAQDLKSAGLILNDLYFKLYLKQEKLDGKIQAGTFKIAQNVTMRQLVEILQDAKKPDLWVRIPEGLMMTEIASLIAKQFDETGENSFDKKEFLALAAKPDLAKELGLPIPDKKPLEGYLYPDTYRLPADASAEYVMTALLKNLKTKIYDKYKEKIEASKFSFHQILNIAAILERETKAPKDRPMVADIMIRRYENNWPFAVDATLLYHFKNWKHEITWQDLQLDTPYNTRKHKGFTPTPICNPGENTIKGVLYPKSNNYWFYISDKSGILHYAVTLDEHNRNINTYLR